MVWVVLGHGAACVTASLVLVALEARAQRWGWQQPPSPEPAANAQLPKPRPPGSSSPDVRKSDSLFHAHKADSVLALAHANQGCGNPGVRSPASCGSWPTPRGSGA